MYVDLCQCADRLGCVRVDAERSVSGRYGPLRVDLGLCEIVRSILVVMDQLCVDVDRLGCCV